MSPLNKELQKEHVDARFQADNESHTFVVKGLTWSRVETNCVREGKNGLSKPLSVTDYCLSFVA